MKKKGIICYPYRLMIPALTIYTVFYIVPLLIGFILSFTNWNIENLSFHGAFLSTKGLKFSGMYNYAAIFKDRLSLLHLKNTIILCLRNNDCKNIDGTSSCTGIKSKDENAKISEDSFLYSGSAELYRCWSIIFFYFENGWHV